MSQNAVCNTTASAKKTRPTLVMLSTRIGVTLHACKETAKCKRKKEPRDVCVFVQAKSAGICLGVCMCVRHQPNV